MPSLSQTIKQAFKENPPLPRPRVHSDREERQLTPAELAAAKREAEQMRAAQRSAAEAKQAARQERRRPRRRPLALSYSLLKARREEVSGAVALKSVDTIFVGVDPAAPPEVLEKASRTEATTTPLRVRPPEPAALTAADIIARLAERKVTLDLAPDKSLVCLAPPGVGGEELRDLLRDFGPLLRGHLRGEPVACSWCTKPATTVLLGGAYACPKHLGD